MAISERTKSLPLIDEITSKLDYNEGLNKEELFSLLNKNLAFFFLFILRLDLKIQDNEFLNELTNRLSEDFIDSDQLFSLHQWYHGLFI